MEAWPGAGCAPRERWRSSLSTTAHVKTRQTGFWTSGGSGLVHEPGDCHLERTQGRVPALDEASDLSSALAPAGGPAASAIAQGRARKPPPPSRSFLARSHRSPWPSGSSRGPPPTVPIASGQLGVPRRSEGEGAKPHSARPGQHEKKCRVPPRQVAWRAICARW